MNKTPNEEKIHNLQKALEMINGCTHRRLRIRYREASNGNKMYANQCLDCGKIIPAATGIWIKQSEIRDIETIEPIDDDLETTLKASDESLRNSLRERLVLAKCDHISEQYYNYLKSPEWKSKRDLVMQRACNICEGCLKEIAIDVHHKTYANIFNEFLFELVALCRGCHEKIHCIHGIKEGE